MVWQRSPPEEILIVHDRPVGASFHCGLQILWRLRSGRRVHWGTVLAEVVKIAGHIVRQRLHVVAERRSTVPCLRKLPPPKTPKKLGVILCQLQKVLGMVHSGGCQLSMELNPNCRKGRYRDAFVID